MTIHRTRVGSEPSGGAEAGRSIIQIGDIFVEYDGLAPNQSDLDVYNTPPAVPWTAREFMAKFTNVELIAIAEAKRTNAQLEIWWTTATAGNVEQDHPDTSAGLTYLQSLGLIDASRIPEIMD